MTKGLKVTIASLMAVVTAAPFIYAYKQAEAMTSLTPVVQAPVQNEDYNQIIKDAQAVMEEYEAKKSEAEAQIAGLQTEYDSLLAYMLYLDEKQNEITIQINQISMKMFELNQAKEETVKNLAAAEEQKAAQYEAMQKRIQYVYENGETGYLDIIFSSANIEDILNRVEYVNEISEYDDKLFADYSATVKQISEYNDLLDIQLATIESVQSAYDEYFAYSEELVAQKKETLEQVEADLGVTEELLEDYIVEIATQQMTIAEAQEAAAKQAAAAAAAAAAVYETQPTYNVAGTGNVSGVITSDATDLGSMIWPLPGVSYISSYFGWREEPIAGAGNFHRGVDIAGPYGTPIVAALAGTVVASTFESSRGNYVMIDHGGDVYTIYMHASSLAVTSGQYVQQGQVIAYEGSTGMSTGPHLHFGVMIGGTYVDPLNYVAY